MSSVAPWDGFNIPHNITEEELMALPNEVALNLKDRGNADMKSGNYDTALEYYDIAIKIDPGLSILYSNRALAHLKLESLGSAIEDGDKAIELDANNVKGYHRRGMAYAGLCMFKLAKRDFEQVLKMRPGERSAMRALEICKKMIRQERFEEAIRADGDGGGIIVRVCRTLSLATFAGNSDMSKYQGPKLELEQLYDSSGGAAGIAVKNMSQEFLKYMVEEVFLKGNQLPKEYVAAIISHAERLFAAEATVVELHSSEGMKISICGDTHGQFYDVLNIFKLFGKVSEEHVYLFNGDFVDRGSWSCEVAILFYCLKLLYPKHFYLNRGNHETNNMNRVYGFEDECNHKYSQRIFNLFSQSFESLPLATLVNNSYLIMHGGLTSDTSITLEDIKKIDRFGQPPRSGAFMELLWSDPQSDNGLGSSHRGLGYAFGPDITQKFVEANGLKKIMRSHEVRMNGVKFEHDGKLVTIFSAPNYCDSQGNLGGIIHVVPGEGNPGVLGNDDNDLYVQTFPAVDHPDIKPMAYSNGGLGF